MGKIFCVRLKELRGDMFQEELAEELGISRATLSHLENGRQEPNLELLEKIADFFNVSVDYLIGRTINKRTDFSDSLKNTINISEALNEIEKLQKETAKVLSKIKQIIKQ